MPHKRSDPLNDPLSKREAQVLALIVAGRRNKETARDLGISPRTVEAHRASIMAKVGARTLADLVRIAVTVPPKNGAVGLAFKAAVERAEQHEALCTRKLRVRIMVRHGGEDGLKGALWISARIAARTNEELFAQGDECERFVPWDRLDDCADQLPRMIDECVAAAEAAVGLRALT